MTALELLPVVPTSGPANRTGTDRLEILTALIAAPSFDPLYRPDVIVVPGDHPHFRWLCGVPACEKPQEPGRDYCYVHRRQWVKLRATGVSVTDFLSSAVPQKRASWSVPPRCVICPDLPAWASSPLCQLHARRWRLLSKYWLEKHGTTVDYDGWLAGEKPFPTFGECLVVACPELAAHPLGLCANHLSRYKHQGRPGGASLHQSWSRRLDRGETVTVAYTDKAAFRRWCWQSGPAHRVNGKLSLLGLPPLLKAEIKWAMFRHAQGYTQGRSWPLTWVQYLTDHCRLHELNSLADLDLDEAKSKPLVHQVGREMADQLQLVYFSRQDTKDAGFLETEHFGVRLRGSRSYFDLTSISQRWLRDMVWDSMADRLLSDPPRSRSGFDGLRRATSELSAYLEAQAPGGGHDPRLLTRDHMVDFVADQRHRAKNGLTALSIYCQGSNRGNAAKKPAIVTNNALSRTFNTARRLLRDALESGTAETIGLDRAFIVALPTFHAPGARRRPFPDDVARILADDANLAGLHSRDYEDRGLRDIWEALVVTGRRCGEVLNVRLECIGRLNKLPVFWHDQTKVGNYDQAIRIPERLYQLLEQRQSKTIARFVQRFGRPPTPRERRQIALFPRRHTNRDLLKGASRGWFAKNFRAWVDTLDIAHCVPHQARHTLATNLLRNGANLTHVKRYLGHVSVQMAEHYVHLANTDPRLEEALAAVWVSGPGSAAPGTVLSAGEPMSRQEAEALAIDLTRRSTPAEGGFCTFQPVVNGNACPWNMDCHNCDKFVLSGADLVYWHRKREQWRTLAERAPDGATADFLHEVFEPTARAIDGLEKALKAIGLLDEALALDLRRPQDYFGRVWNTAFRAQELADHSAAEAVTG
ncbi:tyrosine-type recombinase/integrase [Streptomyces sp. CC208A]|uniref:tyrosine-type recombinase/integrase n=1 Tax=Streptomyces sp. CC208A TaxID=3044573 RepID=UPI0024A7F445|nr:tyrosine-type recombinase/integrase [Streptomyces sp. CC208A]